MRNPNQINNARRRETDAQGKRRVDGDGTYPATRGECACPAWDDAECTHTSHGSNGHVSREGGRDSRSILCGGGEQLEAACERTHETAAPPRTNGDSARTASTAPPHPKKIKTLKRST